MEAVGLKFSSSKLLSSSTAVLFILFFPLLVYFGGMELNYIYFPCLFIFLASLLALKRKLVVNKRNVVIYTCLGFLTVLSLLNISSLRYSFPVVFFLFSFLFLFIYDNTIPSINSKIILILIFLYTAFAGLLLISGQAYIDGRFAGFSESATTFAVFITVLLVISMTHLRSKRISLFFFLATVYLIFLSQTRINLGFVLILPLVVYLLTSRRRRLMFTLVAIFCLNFLYPIYLYLKERTALVAYRYEGGYDPSFNTRIYFQKQVIESIKNGSIKEIAFGHGTEYSRLMILRMNGGDYLPHNDFLRILNDFGVVGFLLFLVMLCSIAIRNITTCCIVLLYLIAFYHNMVYNFFLLLIAMAFLNFDENDSKGHANE